MSFKTNNIPNGEDFSKMLLGKSDKKNSTLISEKKIINMTAR
jgi:hypothetical protein